MMKFILFVLFFTGQVSLAASTGVLIQGYNGDVDIAAAEDLYSAGGDLSIPAAAATTTIVSSSANDAAAGTGARTVKVSGLDSNYLEISETATMNGTNAVTLTNSFLRINYVEVVTAGSGLVAAGAITVKHSSTVLANLEAGFNVSRTALYTVPSAASSGYQAFYLKRAYFGVSNAAGVAMASVEYRESGGLWKSLAVLHGTATGLTNNHVFVTPVSIPAKSDVRIRVLSVGADNTVAYGGFEIEKVLR